MNIFPKTWGYYPPEYNREVHGPYDPAVNYGKRDTPFTEVKLGELGSWFGRRKKSPSAMVQAFSRSYWRYLHTWVFPKKPGPAHLYQQFFMMSLLFMILDYPKIRGERRYRYH